MAIFRYTNYVSWFNIIGAGVYARYTVRLKANNRPETSLHILHATLTLFRSLLRRELFTSSHALNLHLHLHTCGKHHSFLPYAR